MKKNKKSLIIIIASIVGAILVIGLIFLLFNLKDENALTLEENRWIENNKSKVIDVAIINDIPILSYEGEGIVYNYLDYITDTHSLQFNVIPYKLDNSIEYNYKMDLVSNVSSNDIVLLDDNLILVTKENKVYSDIKEITNLELGVVLADKDVVSKYFNSNNIELISYDTYSSLKSSFVSTETEEGEVQQTNTLDGIVIPKTIYTKELIENDYVISYNMNDLIKYFVLKTNGSTELNSILKKDFNKWKNENYDTEYNTNLLENYYKFNNVSDTDQKRLQSKSYSYGFIEYGIYNYLDKNEIFGLNGLILKDFNKFSNLSITYTKYNSLNKLLEGFNSRKIDFMLNIANPSLYRTQTYNTSGVFNKQLVIATGINNTDVIDGIYSLKGKEVLTIKDSYLEKYLIENSVKVKSYNNIEDLTKDFSSNNIVLIDLENYNYYKSSTFKDSKINYIYNTNEKYSFVLNDTTENTLFKDLFNFYLNYNSVSKLVSDNYSDIAYKNSNITYILVLIIIVLCIYVVTDFSSHVKHMMKTIKKNKKINLSKEDKIKYIDQLTSLKNRAYLNSKIETWDESEVYPQSIIIIDLNNVSYINDNYGREEGDKVITEAANILIQHQLQNSEIIRTDGNEFLVYLVGYNEKQIISYLRKLNKEFKNLSHGFGAASGYSIISDAIKTIDDAVNEATLDMKNNKEDIDY